MTANKLLKKVLLIILMIIVFRYIGLAIITFTGGSVSFNKVEVKEGLLQTIKNNNSS